MTSKSFIQSKDYQEFKEILNSELVVKPLDIKVKDTDKSIALECRASQIAAEKILKVIKTFEDSIQKEYLPPQKFT